MTSLLLLNISYVLANVLVLSDTLLFEYFSLQGKKLMEVGFCQNIQQMTSEWRQIRSLCEPSYDQKLEMMSNDE